MDKILCYLYDGMADFEISLLLHELKNTGNKEIISISESNNKLTAMSGLSYVADKTISQIDEVDMYDALIIPGGPINNNQNEIIDIVNKMVSSGKLVCAICFAPQFFGRAGVLNNYKFTTSCSKERIIELGCEDPFNWENYVEQRCVVDRNVITAKGVAFVDFAEKVCDYLNIFDSEEIKQNRIGKIKQVEEA